MSHHQKLTYGHALSDAAWKAPNTIEIPRSTLGSCADGAQWRNYFVLDVAFGTMLEGGQCIGCAFSFRDIATGPDTGSTSTL